MEIELKYSIPTPKVADDIWKDKLFFNFEEMNSREEICFIAKYFVFADSGSIRVSKRQIGLNYG